MSRIYAIADLHGRDDLLAAAFDAIANVLTRSLVSDISAR